MRGLAFLVASLAARAVESAAVAEWRLGSPGGSCASACEAVSKACNADAFIGANSEVDSVAKMTAVVASLGASCSGGTNTAWGTSSDVPTVHNNHCFVSAAGRSADSFSCTRSVAGKSRLCYCVGSCGSNEALSGKGGAYRGCQTKTRTGKTCQKWSSQLPHSHTRTAANYPSAGLGDHNYCRNPDGEPSIWCYTTDPSRRWESCDALPEPGRCGPLFSGTSCTGHFSGAGHPEYCNEANGWCGTSAAHQNAQGSTTYDYAPPDNNEYVIINAVSAELSSVYAGLDASLCIDGKLDNWCHANDLWATKQDPWLQLDLGSSFTIARVTIHNRPTAYWYGRFGLHEIWVSDSATTPATKCYTTTAPASAGPFHDPCAASGRYVRVVLPGSNRILNLAEVQVERLAGALSSSSILEPEIEVAEDAGQTVTTAVAATATTAAVASVTITASAAIVSAGAAGATGAGATSAAGAAGAGGGGAAALNIIAQVQSLHVLSMLTSVQESAPSFASFAGPLGLFNLEVSPPWSASSGADSHRRRLGEAEDRTALRVFDGHAFYVILTLVLGSALHLRGEFYLSAQKRQQQAGGSLAILLEVFTFPGPEVLFLILFYQGACTLSSRAIAAAIARDEHWQLVFALVYFIIFPIGWFVTVAWHMLLVVPADRTAAFDAEKREWAESLAENASARDRTYVKRFGTLFTSYNGIRLAQIFVMLTMVQKLLVGMCAGFLGTPALATTQVVLVTLLANVEFAAFVYLRPLVHTSELKTKVYNADGCLKAGMSAVTLVLVLVGTSVSTPQPNILGGQQSVSELSQSWVNRGVMACMMLALAFSATVLVWDIVDSLWYAVTEVIAARRSLKARQPGSTGTEGAVRGGRKAETATKDKAGQLRKKTKQRLVV